jgi:hypothetical protein
MQTLNTQFFKIEDITLLFQSLQLSLDQPAPLKESSLTFLISSLEALLSSFKEGTSEHLPSAI